MPTVLGLEIFSVMPSFLLLLLLLIILFVCFGGGSGNLNIGTYLCKVITLSTEPFPLSLHCLILLGCEDLFCLFLAEFLIV